jgi:signal transduction histidine kinase
MVWANTSAGEIRQAQRGRMEPSDEFGLVPDLLTLGCLNPDRDPEGVCSRVLSGCHARAVLLFIHDAQEGTWCLESSSGLNQAEQAVVTAGWLLSPPSIWQTIPSGAKLPAVEGRIQSTPGMRLPASVDPTALRDVLLVRTDDGSRLLLVLGDPDAEDLGCTRGEWEMASRFLALILRQWQLQGSLDERESALAQDRSNLMALLEILDSVSKAPPINNLYESTVDVLQKITRADAVVLRRYDDVHECFHLVAERGLSADLKAKILCVAQKPIFDDMLRDKKADFRPTINPEAWAQGYKQVVSVPLISGRRVVGSVGLLDRSGRPPSADELRWLELLGRCVALMIHQVQQAEAERESAILQERSHLAQEIHDGLAQLLAAIQLLIEEQRSLLEEGDVGAALELTNRLSLIAGDAYGSVREEILALHDGATLDGGLQGFLEDHLMRFERQWGIASALEVETGYGEPTTLDLHPAVQSQLARIIQEALANVRRHAGATKVRMRVRQTEGEVQVLVQDNGSGFDTERIPPSAYGLRIMQERAISVGGAITVSSAPQEGTVLRIVVPRSRLETHGVAR